MTYKYNKEITYNYIKIINKANKICMIILNYNFIKF